MSLLSTREELTTSSVVIAEGRERVTGVPGDTDRTPKQRDLLKMCTNTVTVSLVAQNWPVCNVQTNRKFG